MTTIPTIAREVIAADEKRTAGTWEWFGNTKMNEVYLATKERGRVFVMDFARWGMRSAQPRFHVRIDDKPGTGIMRTLGELAADESPLGPRFEVSYRRQFVGIKHPDAAFIPLAVNHAATLARAVLRMEKVVEAAKAWAEANCTCGAHGRALRHTSKCWKESSAFTLLTAIGALSSEAQP